ncbi:OmpA family protein [Aequorivita sp. CIP111184]|uniref:OmpA family protein n=1 Tax=Aequorivita sp. CIP111184 TaxID=2211356 RepID=UPI000DBBDB10|nr:OmpA family protein [Aequorivita sp. CIP111184]SRX54878.1 Outer membrane porin F [Aequorivita sp. CIP111184]
MKKPIQNYHFNITIKFLLVALLFSFAPQQSNAQIFKKLTQKAQDKIEKEAEDRTERRVNKKIDKTFDETEDAIDGKTSEDNNSENNSNNTNNSSNSTAENGNQASNNPNVVWNKFDFIPGDTVIFEDGPSANEENGEFPSRWDLYRGSAEIGEVNGEPVIMFLNGGGRIVPYLKNSKEDYLPEVFTIDLDVWFDGDDSHNHRYWIKFKDDKNQFNKTKNDQLEIYSNGLEFLDTDKRYPGRENVNWNVNKVGVWKHISIAYTKGKFKAYMDDTRLINVPHLEMNPWGITLLAENDMMYVKNFRIAKGGVKYYDRVLSEGKIIVNGIKFDTNKATLKPESMGPINEIYSLMEKQADLNFSVEGHTDSDGDDTSNMTLSKARGKTVMDKLIEMGISANRLKASGFGESKPIDNNTTPEGKANNRRVEFVKF